MGTKVSVVADVDLSDVMSEVSDAYIEKEARERGIWPELPDDTEVLMPVYEHYRLHGGDCEALRKFIYDRIGKIL